MRQSSYKMSKSILLSIATGLLLAAGTGFGQTTAPLQFEVASVKPAALDIMKLAAQMQSTGQMPKMGPHVDGARAEYIFMGLKDLIAEAYKVKPFQITGPDWLNNLAGQRFDIFAKMPEGSTKEQAPQMLQALLAERFKLVLHRDNKEHSVMALVVAKGGAKLPDSPADKDFDENTPLKPGETQMDTPDGPIRMTADAKNGSSVVNMGKRGTWTQKMDPTNGTLHMEGSKVTMSGFADMLTQMTQMTGGGGTQVIDMTGLKGNYVVAMEFSLADLIKMAQAVGVNVPSPEAGRGSPADAASEPGGSTSVQAAVQKLGLKLEARKAPTEQLIVDKLEKMPTEN
jgi:uncharacterized protein (TIGR03435 family)